MAKPRPFHRSPTVFISYRREDSGDVTGRIRDQVASAFGDEHVYMDIDSIPLGVDFRTHLAESVAKCDVVLAVIGRHWLSVADESGDRRIDHPSDFVRLELEAALERGIPVVPVLVLGAEPLPHDGLPASIQDLAYRQATSVRRDPDFHPDMHRLLDGLVAPASTPPRGPTEGGAAPLSPRVPPNEGDDDGPDTRKWLLIGGAVLSGVAAVILSLVLLGGDDGTTGRAATTSTTSSESTSPSAVATEDTSAPEIIDQVGQTLHARGYTMELPPKWSTDGSGTNDTVTYLPSGGSATLYVSGPYENSGESAEFIARQAAESKPAKTHTEPTTRTVDGVKIAEYSGTYEYGTGVTAYAVTGGKEYDFELTVYSSGAEFLAKAREDFSAMVSSIKWDR